MTDRLREWLDEARNCPTDHAPELYAALRAVVELHQNKAGVYKFYCQACEYRSDPWPCPTIRAVEKEVLK